VEILETKNAFNDSKEWQSMQKVIDKNESVAYMVTGPTNCGKSTLCSYLMNMMTSVTSEIYFMDIDCGQPNF
jgi:polynucleotide 5'-kinase involved in rRNA processing